MSDNPDKIEAEVEANRANVESTLDALKTRLSMESVTRDATRYLGIEDARGTLETAGREINANPVAFGLIGLGLAFLATGVTRRDTNSYSAPYGRSYTQVDHEKPHLRERAQGYVDQAREGASAYSDRVRESASGYADAANRKLHDAQHALHDGYDSARRRASDLQHRAGRQMESQPLLFGALAVAAGAVIAAALPRTSVEDKWIGPGRDHLMDEATHTAADLAERAKAAGQAGYAAAVNTAKDEGLVPTGETTLAEKVQHVAEAAVEGAKSEVKDDRTA